MLELAPLGPEHLSGHASCALASWVNSEAGVANEEEPQSRQTRSFGNTKTPGRFAFLRPGKTIFTSAGNSAWLLDSQNVHDMAMPPNDYSQSTQEHGHNVGAVGHLVCGTVPGLASPEKRQD
jgi:hypothetical protein